MLKLPPELSARCEDEDLRDVKFIYLCGVPFIWLQKPFEF